MQSFCSAALSSLFGRCDCFHARNDNVCFRMCGSMFRVVLAWLVYFDCLPTGKQAKPNWESLCIWFSNLYVDRNTHTLKKIRKKRCFQKGTEVYGPHYLVFELKYASLEPSETHWSNVRGNRHFPVSHLWRHLFRKRESTFHQLKVKT